MIHSTTCLCTIIILERTRNAQQDWRVTVTSTQILQQLVRQRHRLLARQLVRRRHRLLAQQLVRRRRRLLARLLLLLFLRNQILITVLATTLLWLSRNVLTLLPKKIKHSLAVLPTL